MALLAIGAELLGDVAGFGFFTELGEAAAGFLEPLGISVKGIAKAASIGKTVYDTGRAVKTIFRNPTEGTHHHITHSDHRRHRQRRRRRSRNERHPFHKYNPPKGSEPYDYPAVGLLPVPQSVAGQGIVRPVAQLGEAAVRYLIAHESPSGQAVLDRSAYPPDMNQLKVGGDRSSERAGGAATNTDGDPNSAFWISMGNSMANQELLQHPHSDAVSQSFHNMAQSYSAPMNIKV